MNPLLNVALIAGGGAFGALMRAGVSELVIQRYETMPALGTLAVNVIGCLIIGMARAAVDTMDWGSPATRVFVFTGFLGAFTTFSTFEADTAALWHDGFRVLAATYMIGSVAAGMLAFTIGWFGVGRLFAA